jgi:hypothetical protein
MRTEDIIEIVKCCLDNKDACRNCAECNGIKKELSIEILNLINRYKSWIEGH